MVESSPEARFMQLLSQYLEGGLPESDGEELLSALEERIAEDPSRSDDVCRNLWVHYLLGNHYRIEKQEVTLHIHDETDGDLPYERDEAALSLPVSTDGKPLRPWKPLSRKEKRFSTFLIGLLLFLFCVSVYWEFRPPSEDGRPIFAGKKNPLGRVLSVSEPVFAEGDRIVRADQTLFSEEVRLESGMLEIELTSGVRIVLEGPAALNLHSAMKTFCEQGRLSVEVPPGAEGFEVFTPRMSVRDLGTAFVVDVTETESSVHVIRGKVEADPLNNVWMPLTEGVGLVVPSTGTHRQISANALLFIDRLRMNGMAKAYEIRCLKEWADYRSRWTDDPALLLAYDFESIEKRSVSDVSPRSRNGVVLGGTPGTGRWPGKRGFQFRSKQHGIETTLSDELDSFTLFASIRINSTEHFNQVLFSSRTGTDEEGHSGHLLWQLQKNGSLYLGYQSERDRNVVAFSALDVFGPGNYGTWRQVATVYDAKNKKVDFYLDGRPLASETLHRATSIRLGKSVLGNAFWEDRTRTARFFNGVMDQFLLFDRALAEEEIRQLCNF